MSRLGRVARVLKSKTKEFVKAAAKSLYQTTTALVALIVSDNILQFTKSPYYTFSLLLIGVPTGIVLFYSHDKTWGVEFKKLFNQTAAWVLGTIAIVLLGIPEKLLGLFTATLSTSNAMVVIAVFLLMLVPATVFNMADIFKESDKPTAERTNKQNSGNSQRESSFNNSSSSGSRERLRAILQKPYVRIPLILVILLYVGFVIVLIFIAISSLYVLGTLIGISTLQLLTGAISAGSAVASATAAILIWRGNVRARNRVLIDRVLGPVYSEIRHIRELLDSWKSKANEIAVSTPFLKQVPSDWLYYTLDEDLRNELDSFKGMIEKLVGQRDLCRNVASDILIKTASTVFDVHKVSIVYLWRSHSWVEGQTHGENGSMPVWQLIVASSPLWAPSGYYVHLLQIVDFDGQHQFSLPILNQNKERINLNEFEKFWNLATNLASQDTTIVSFRQLLDQAIAESSRLERQLNSEIKRLQ